MNTFIKKHLLILFIIFNSAYSYAEKKDLVTNVLSICSSTPCLITESVLFIPVFPWFQYPLDAPATQAQLKRFDRISGDFDLMMSKDNNSYSGYKGLISIYKKWFGFDLGYKTLNNGEEDQKYFGTHVLFHFMPRSHLQPGLAFGWKYVKTNSNSGGGFEFSFFNYKISFNRKFHLYLVNYIGWIKDWTMVEGLIGIEYYVYPTISFKPCMEIKHVFSELIYGVQFGLSFKM